jgi:phenylacetate-CoA ligase
MYRRIAGSLFAVFDGSKGRQASRCLRRLEKTQWLKRSELEDLKLKKLRALLKHAYDKVPYYHESFKRAGFRPEDFRKVEDLRMVPVLEKSDLRTHVPEMVAREFAKRRLVQWETSGTTALPVKFFRDREDVSWGVGAELRGYSWAGYRVGDRLARIWSLHPGTSAKFSFKVGQFFNRERVLDLKDVTESSMRVFAEDMQKFKPDFVRGYAMGICVFASFLLKNNSFKPSPKAIFTTATTLLPHYEKTIKQAFGCGIFDYYACSEVSHIAADCGENEGLHVSEENVLLETVDDSEPVADGEDGKVLLTNLNAFGMPIIRYDVGDVATIMSDSCSCGRELSLVKVVGRTYDYFLHSDGSFSALKDFQTFFEGLPIQEFQVVQETYDDLVVKIVPKLEYTAEHTEFIERNIKLRGRVRIRVELVDSIPLERSGKIKRVVSQFGERYDYFGRQA